MEDKDVKLTYQDTMRRLSIIINNYQKTWVAIVLYFKTNVEPWHIFLIKIQLVISVLIVVEFASLINKIEIHKPQREQ